MERGKVIQISSDISIIFVYLGLVLVLCIYTAYTSFKKNASIKKTTRRSPIPLEKVVVIDQGETKEEKPDTLREEYFKRKEEVDKRLALVPLLTHEKVKVKEEIQILRGGEFIGNRFRFKVKIVNDSEYTITDVMVFLISYPNKSLRLIGEDDIRFPKIEPGGFRSPQFDLIPTQDCVKGDITAGASYIDAKGKAHVLTAVSLVIRSVCDLLNPEIISPEKFTDLIQEQKSGEMDIKVSDWTPEEMHEKALRTLEEANFHEVLSSLVEEDGTIEGSVFGWAKGKYTGKNLGVQILISGPSQKKGASCKIIVTGEDDAMIMPAIDDLHERLSVWLCPLCGCKIEFEDVEALKKGYSIVCEYCDTTIGR